MRSESVNIRQENENSDVVLMLYEDEVPIYEKIYEYQDNESEDEIEQDQVFFMNQTTKESKINNDIWIANCGASCHARRYDGFKEQLVKNQNWKW